MSVAHGWNEAALGDVCRIVSGATPKTGEPSFWGGGIRWLTPNDLSKDRTQTLNRGERSLTTAGYESSSARLFPAGSVIVSSRAPIGYVAIAGAEMCTNQGCKTAVPPEFIDSKYLYWYLLAAKPDLEARASGTTFKEISSTRFAETRLRWPSLVEQRRIVNLLEDHLSHLDAADNYLAAAKRRRASLRASALAEVFRGKRVNLGELAVMSGYGTSEKCVVGGPGASVVRIPNLIDGSVDLADEKSVANPAADVASSMLMPGDLLIVRTNGSVALIGRSAVVQPGIDAAFASYLIRYRFDTTRVFPEWVQAMLSAPQSRALLERLAASSAGQHNLSLRKLDGVPIPLPMLEQQESYLRQLAARDDELSRLKRATEVASRDAANLRRSLLTAAFSGRLTSAASDVRVVEDLIHA